MIFFHLAEIVVVFLLLLSAIVGTITSRAFRTTAHSIVKQTLTRLCVTSEAAKRGVQHGRWAWRYDSDCPFELFEVLAFVRILGLWWWIPVRWSPYKTLAAVASLSELTGA